MSSLIYGGRFFICWLLASFLCRLHTRSLEATEEHAISLSSSCKLGFLILYLYANRVWNITTVHVQILFCTVRSSLILLGFTATICPVRSSLIFIRIYRKSLLTFAGSWLLFDSRDTRSLEAKSNLSMTVVCIQQSMLFVLSRLFETRVWKYVVNHII